MSPEKPPREYKSNKDFASWFRIRSIGSENLKVLPRVEQLEKAKLYKQEMDDFTEFLREKYLTE